MKVINDNQIPEPRKDRKHDTTWTGNLYLGVILIAVGVVWLFYNFDVVSPRFFDVVLSWRMLLVVVGGYLVAVRKYTAGTIIGGFGLLFVLTDLFNIYISFSKVILPAIVIAVGVSLLLTHLRKR